MTQVCVTACPTQTGWLILGFVVPPLLDETRKRLSMFDPHCWKTAVLATKTRAIFPDNRNGLPVGGSASHSKTIFNGHFVGALHCFSTHMIKWAMGHRWVTQNWMVKHHRWPKSGVPFFELNMLEFLAQTSGWIIITNPKRAEVGLFGDDTPYTISPDTVPTHTVLENVEKLSRSSRPSVCDFWSKVHQKSWGGQNLVNHVFGGRKVLEKVDKCTASPKKNQKARRIVGAYFLSFWGLISEKCMGLSELMIWLRHKTAPRIDGTRSNMPGISAETTWNSPCPYPISIWPK